MIRIISALFAYFIATIVQASSLMPETTHRITLSNRDVNRVVCQTGAINDVYYSQEKAIQVKSSGRNAFVKFLVLDDGQKKDYVTSKSEFYVVCNGDVYTLIATPKTTDAKTIYLGNPIKNKMESNIELLSPLSLEDQAVSITKSVFTGDIPDSFNVHKLSKRWMDYTTNLKVRPIRKITIDGVGLNLTEYQVAAYADQKLSEQDFLDARLSPNIIAVTVHPMNLQKGETSRLFLVEKEID